ncbi:marine proteobacterial sortase target protein [candidate division CSSED10-310 bacterium]|uniref:Marine proteobacterial sortase target protein n=1 Tax=candidate division CSSED10-310 bacterium TaxID=2855610 RepID=A0ABV6YV90_UNCC1
MNTSAQGLQSSISHFILLGIVLIFALPLTLAVAQEEELNNEDFPFRMEDLGPAVTPVDVKQGSLLFRTERQRTFVQAPILKTDVQLFVTGMVVRAEVSQWFFNPTQEWLEGVYVFPLPENAAVDHLRMVIGHRIIQGQIEERAQAKKMYQKAKKAGRKASLLEQERPNIFTTSVANIGPGEEIEVVIQYQHNADYNQGTFSLRFPMVVARRYIPGKVRIEGVSGTGWAVNTPEVPDAQLITPPILHPGNGPANPVSINIELETGFPIDSIVSLYHQIEQYRMSDSFYTILLRKDAVPANRDFVLEWKPHRDHEPQAALFTQEGEDGIYTLMMVMPPDEGNAGFHRLTRECIFVIDTSGSMHGDSIRQAKEALILALDNLSIEDSFNIIQFNSRHEMLFPESQRATDVIKEEALWYVENLKAKGGTKMLPALQAALQDLGEDKGVRQVIFITDGSVGNEGQLFKYIIENLYRSRLFTVGIGSAPNSHFMRKAAEYGRGTFTYIGSTSEVATKIGQLFKKLENPVLSDIQISWNDPDVEFYPNPIPDLYLGEPIMVTGRLFHEAGHIIVTGERDQVPWEISLKLNRGKEQAGIDKLWARRKIASLMDQYRDSKDKDIIRQQITDVALNHQLVSKFTSLVALDKTPTRPQEKSLTTKPVPVNLPHGWSSKNTVGKLPQTATPAPLFILLGWCSFIAFICLRLSSRRS